MTRARVIALVLLAGCAGSTPASDASADAIAREPSVQIGTGLSSFAPFAEETPTLELVMGIQGGWHLELAARLVGFDAPSVVLEWTVVRSSDAAVLARLPLRVGPRGLAADGDGWVRLAERVILDIGAPSEVAPGMLEITLVASDGFDHRATDARVVRLVDEIDELGGR